MDSFWVIYRYQNIASKYKKENPGGKARKNEEGDILAFCPRKGRTKRENLKISIAIPKLTSSQLHCGEKKTGAYASFSRGSWC